MRYDENGGAKAQRFAVVVPVAELTGDHTVVVVVSVGGQTVAIDENIPAIGDRAAPNTSLTYRGPDEPEIPEKFPGDVNGDGIITTKDLLKLKKYIVGDYGDEDINVLNADINEDGKINSRDARELRLLIVS